MSSEPGEDDVEVFAVLRPDEKAEPEALLAFCEERMAYFMVPRFVEFTDALPKTATERVRKFSLGEQGIGNTWDREKAGYKLKRV